MPSKKTAKKGTSAKKAAKKTATKKTAARKAVKKAAKKAAKKMARKAPVKKKAAAKKPATKKAAKKAVSKPKASELIKQSSHTPAIFKGAPKRTVNVLFTLDEVRDLLKKRAEEEKKDRELNAAAKKKVAKMAKTENNVVKESEARKSKHAAASLDDILGIATPGGGPGAGDGIPRKFRKYYNLLIELRDHVRAELNLHSSDTLKRSQKEDAGDLSISVDAGTDNFDRDFALSLLSSEQESLKEIEAAIDRIHNGTYGCCEVTGEPIAAERLEAVPFTRFSLEGQRQWESTSRKRISRTGAFLNEGSGEAISFGTDDDDN